MTDHFPTVRTRRPQPLSVVWSLLSAPQSLMVLLGCVALALILSDLIPQIPAQAKDDPGAWLALQQGLSGAKLWLVRELGLYDVFHTFWFRALLVSTGLVLLVRLMDSSELAWRSTVRRPWTWDDVSRGSGKRATRDISTDLQPDEVLARARRMLEDGGYSCSLERNHLVSVLVAVRRGLLLWAQPLGYAAVLLALAGLAVLNSAGWQSMDWRPVVGETIAVGRSTPFVIRVDGFALQSGDDGRQQGSYAEITWLDGDTAIKAAKIREDTPSTHQGIAVRLGGYVPAVRIRGRDESGQSLVLQKPGDIVASPGEATIVFSAVDAQPLLFIPAEDRLLVLSFEPRTSDGRPALHLAIPAGVSETDQVGKILHDSGQISLDGLQLDVDLSYRPVLRIDHRPGVALILAGLALVLVALAVTWRTPGFLLWIVVPHPDPGQDNQGEVPRWGEPTKVQVLTLSRAAWTRWWRCLLEDLCRGLTNGD